jgi:hypothetical protein
LEDYNEYECYNCGRHKIQQFKEGDNLYLQNSGSIDIVCVKQTKKYCDICEVKGYPNIYKWVQPDNTFTFALHITNNQLSDAHVSESKEYCHIEIAEVI